MCNRYRPSRPESIRAHFGVDVANFPPGDVFPRGLAPLVRRRRDAVDHEREAVIGQWALIPWFARSPKLPYSTNNARSEGLTSAASYKQPWARSQRCLIPADVFWEPNWETGKNEWWAFRRADGRPWGLAGLWSRWTDISSGEILESFTMLTVNADTHPLMRRMHKPDPKLAPHKQDKRSVVPIDPADYDLWLAGPPDDASELLRPAPAEVFDARPSES